jgi:hypothetical protein
MTLAEIAKELEKPYGTVKITLFRMVKEGLLARGGRGCYRLPLADPMLFEETEDAADD